MGRARWGTARPGWRIAWVSFRRFSRETRRDGRGRGAMGAPWVSAYSDRFGVRSESTIVVSTAENGPGLARIERSFDGRNGRAARIERSSFDGRNGRAARIERSSLDGRNGPRPRHRPSRTLPLSFSPRLPAKPPPTRREPRPRGCRPPRRRPVSRLNLRPPAAMPRPRGRRPSRRRPVSRLNLRPPVAMPRTAGYCPQSPIVARRSERAEASASPIAHSPPLFLSPSPG